MPLLLCPLQTSLPPPHTQSYLDRAFDKLDIDKDGSISLDELLDKLPPAVRGGGAAAEAERRTEAKLMLREADSNGDGKIR